MASLGSVFLELRVRAGELKKGLTGARKDVGAFAGDAEKKTGRVGKAFDSIRTKAADAAKQIPLVGGAVSKMVMAMTGPVGLAVAAIAGIGLAAVGVVKQVAGVTAETRILRNEVGLSAEASQGWIHVAKQMGSDADAVTDIFREMGIRLGEAAAEGTGPAAESMKRLGISIADLQGLKPEEQFALLHAEISKIEDPTKRAFEAEELFGGAVEAASGLINANTAELVAQANAYAENNAHSSEVISAQEELGKLWQQAKASLSPITKELAAALIPALRDFMAAVIPLTPVITTLISVALTPLKQGFNVITSALNILTSLMRGDFTGALNHAKNFFINTATIILDAGAKIVGLFNKDMANSIQGLADDLKDLKRDTESEMGAADQAVRDASKSIVAQSGEAATGITKIGTAAEASATETEGSMDRVVSSLETMRTNAVTDSEAVTEALGDIIQKMKDTAQAQKDANAAMKTANATHRADELTANKNAWGVTDVEYGIAQASLKTISSTKYADLIQQAEEFGVEDLALLLAHNTNLEIEAIAATNSRMRAVAEETAAGVEMVNAELDKIEKEIQVRVNVARPTFSNNSGDPGGSEFVAGISDNPLAWFDHDLIDSTRAGGTDVSMSSSAQEALTEAQAAVDSGSANSITEFINEGRHLNGAQHGALIRGVRNPFGRMIRVGENGTDEGIFPLPDGMLNALRSGGTSRPERQQPMEFPIFLGDEKLATIYLKGKRVAVREERD